ncbi:hypothetical protein ECZU51_65020 [Escherichia coli]|nr:hypothetical protein ECZU51_65020 [Escherichia coli]
MEYVDFAGNGRAERKTVSTGSGAAQEEAEAEARRKEQEYDARLKHHDNHRLSRETALAGVITGLGRAREPGTGRITRYMMLSNRAGEFTVWVMSWRITPRVFMTR